MHVHTRRPFRSPPQALNHAGKPRRVGFELELAGLQVEQLASIVRQLFGGEITTTSRFHNTVNGTSLGTFTVEFDSDLLKEKRYEEALSGFGIDITELVSAATLEDVIVDIAKTLVPCEVITPPMPITAIPEVERLREALQEARAKGTGSSLLYAFGFQINIDVPDTDTGTLLRFLRAFILLCDWIKERQGIDLTRRLSPYIDNFPEGYQRMVVDPGYAPASVQVLIADYLEHNPTRNRPLDLLPLFSFLDERLIGSSVEDPHLIKPRPTFHYRLPDCRIDDPSWTIAGEWRTWLRVEELAGDGDRLRAMSEAFLARPSFPLDLLEESWAQQVESFIHQPVA